MPDDTLTKVKQISSEILSGRNVRVVANCEDYYAVEALNPDGALSTWPPLWVDPHSTEDQIRAKLSYEFRQASDPDSDPDDLSVPNLQTEGRQQQGS